MFHGKIALRVVRLLLLVNFVSEFRLKLMYISLIVSFWSSLMCAAAIVFFVCTNILNLLNLKTNSDRLFQKFLKLPNLHMLIKQSLSLPRDFAVGTFGELQIVFSTKVNLPYLLYSTARMCCLQYIKQNCSLKTFLRTSILMTQASLYPFSLLELI